MEGKHLSKKQDDCRVMRKYSDNILVGNKHSWTRCWAVTPCHRAPWTISRHCSAECSAWCSLCMQMYHSITNAMTLGPGEMLEPMSYGQPPQQMLQGRRSSKRGDRGGVMEIEAVPEKHPQQISAEKPRPLVRTASCTFLLQALHLLCWLSNEHCAGGGPTLHA